MNQLGSQTSYSCNSLKSLRTKMKNFTLKILFVFYKNSNHYITVFFFHKQVYSTAQTIDLHCQQFAICEFAYMLIFICNLKSTLAVFCSLLWTCACTEWWKVLVAWSSHAQLRSKQVSALLFQLSYGKHVLFAL